MASTPTSRPLSATGTGGGPSPVTPSAKASLARSTPPGRRTSVRKPNGTTASPSTASPLSGKSSPMADPELSKLTRDQMITLLTSERKVTEDLRREKEEADESLGKAQDELEEKERQLGVVKVKLGEREKDVERMEEDMSRQLAAKDTAEAQSKELERTKAQMKEADRKLREQVRDSLRLSSWSLNLATSAGRVVRRRTINLARRGASAKASTFDTQQRAPFSTSCRQGPPRRSPYFRGYHHLGCARSF